MQKKFVAHFFVILAILGGRPYFEFFRPEIYLPTQPDNQVLLMFPRKSGCAAHIAKNPRTTIRKWNFRYLPKKSF